MKLATFLPPGASEPVAGEVRGDEVVAFALRHRPRPPRLRRPHARRRRRRTRSPTSRCWRRCRSRARSSASASTTPPTPPRPARELPEAPMVFLKLPSSSVPGSGPVRCPAVVKRLDYEVELAVVMGADGEIAGYAVADDVSARDLQKREPRWVRAKGFDTSCPWGPWITTADEVPDPRGAADLQPGQRRDRARTRTTADLVFGPRALVDFIAETCTLAPGDLILTGTPQGVGQAMDPPRFLAAGRRRALRDRGPGRDRARDRMRLAADTTGEGPAVLLVHGFPDSRRRLAPPGRAARRGRLPRDRARPARLRRLRAARGRRRLPRDRARSAT